MVRASTTSTLLVPIALSIALAAPAFADGATDEECDTYRQECIDAKALGSHDAGICTVERLECTNAPNDATAGAGARREPPRAPLRQPSVGGGHP